MANKVHGVETSIRKRPDGTLIIRYHQTDVVTVKPDRTIILNTGGWRTATTKKRMNQAAIQYKLGYKVFQKNKNWYVQITKTDGTYLIDRFDGNFLTIPAHVFQSREVSSEV